MPKSHKCQAFIMVKHIPLRGRGFKKARHPIVFRPHVVSPLPSPALEDPENPRMEAVPQVAPLGQGAVRKLETVAAWREIREGIHNTLIELKAPPVNARCFVCESEPAELWRCTDCGPDTVLCGDCVVMSHKDKNILHDLEIWQDCGYTRRLPTSFEWHWRRMDGHVCSSFYSRLLRVYDHFGRMHDVWLQFCQCEAEALSLIRYSLWPCTPRQPQTAVASSLLNQITNLQLESGVSLKAICQSLNFPNVKQGLYTALTNEAYEEFRHAVSEVDMLRRLAPDSSNGTECPLCPKENGTVIIAADALFGLPRKRSSGVSYEASKHGETFFANQHEVDVFVAAHKSPNEGCQGFQAGDAIRSKPKTSKLDVTGVFGLACKHEHPLRFLNLTKGEGLANAVFLLKDIKRKYSERNVDVIFMYDIACKLQPYIQKRFPDLEEGTKFVVPAFHAYGHELDCQMALNTRNVEGAGLADGEQMERLWSYLRRLGKVTKEMTPSHRVDLLTDALLRHGTKIRHKQLDNIPQRLSRANKTAAEAEGEMGEILQALPGMTVEAVRLWGRNVHLTQKRQSSVLSWEEQYAEQICEHQLAMAQQEIIGVTVDVGRIERTLQRMERIHTIGERWSPASRPFQMALQVGKEKRLKGTLSATYRLVIERKFLSGLIKKYAEGQSIAIRLSRRLKNVAKQIKGNIKQYNSRRQHIVSTLPSALTYEETIQVESAVWSCSTGGTEDNGQFQVKQALFHLLSLQERAIEEKGYIEGDVLAAVRFYSNEIELLRTAGLHFSDGSRFCVGARSAIAAKLRHQQESLDKCSSFVALFRGDSTTMPAELDDDEDDEDDEEDEEDGGISEEEDEEDID